MIAVLALLSALGPLAIDMYLPAFPEMAADLGTSASSIQLTLTAVLFGQMPTMKDYEHFLEKNKV